MSILIKKQMDAKNSNLKSRAVFEDVSPITQCVEGSMELLAEGADIISAFSKSMYISETYNSPEILTEGVGDFFKSVQEWIKRVIKLVKDIVSNFLIHINAKFMDTERFVEKYRSKLESLDVDFEMTVNDFNISVDSPDFNVGNKIIDEYNQDLRSLANMSNEQYKKKRSEDIRNHKVLLWNASIIGESKPMQNSEILATYKKFIYGRSYTKKITSNDYMQTVNSFKTLKQKAKDISNNQSEILRLLNEISLFFKQNPSSFYDKGQRQYSGRVLSVGDGNRIEREKEEQIFSDETDDSKKVLEFFNNKYSEVNATISLINSLLGIKMTAVKEEVSQASKIIKEGIKKENQRGGI